MAYLAPTVRDFKEQFRRDFPFACPLATGGGGNGAIVDVTLSGGKVTGLTMTDGGSGYPDTVSTILYGGGGRGARANTTVTSGAVTAIAVTSQGFGYTSAPTVYIQEFEGDNSNDKAVTDFDIVNAFLAVEAFGAPQQLFATQDSYSTAYNLLAAHFMVTSFLASSQGVMGKPAWLTASKSVGPISESFQIPERVQKSVTFSRFSATTYGVRFLEIIAPRLVGNLVTFYRETAP